MFLFTGCLSTGTSGPVTVLDAETHQPVASAEVRLIDATAASTTATSDRTGVAQFRTSADAGVTVEASATGYLQESKFEACGDAAVVELFVDPRPVIELVLPVGFHGLVRAELRIAEGTPPSPGQRRFECVVSAAGEVIVDGPPTLKHTLSPDYQARFADETVLVRNAKMGAADFWWLKADGGSATLLCRNELEH